MLKNKDKKLLDEFSRWWYNMHNAIALDGEYAYGLIQDHDLVYAFKKIGFLLQFARQLPRLYKIEKAANDLVKSIEPITDPEENYIECFVGRKELDKLKKLLKE